MSHFTLEGEGSEITHAGLFFFFFLFESKNSLLRKYKQLRAELSLSWCCRPVVTWQTQAGGPQAQAYLSYGVNSAPAWMVWYILSQ